MPIFASGDSISGTYEFERFLGEGATAEVYRVKHRFLGRQAMKVFKAAGMTSEESEKMLAEALLLSKIGHPNIIRVFDANVVTLPKGQFGYFTMEYIAGGSLDTFWRNHGDAFVPTPTVITIFQQICRGLSVAHSETPPIIHRDIKTQNILIGYDGSGIRARLSDFGLAKHVNPLTMLASAKGTMCFKAPEVFLDYTSDSPAGDIWAVGCAMYLLLTDRLPFPDLLLGDIIEHTDFEKPLLLPSKFNIHVDRFLDEIVLRCLAINPLERYPNATALLKDLDRWKPRQHSNKKSIGKDAVDSGKTALGTATGNNNRDPQQLIAEALRKRANFDTLSEAADLMEEALTRAPQYKQQYEYLLRLWRRGISN